MYNLKKSLLLAFCFFVYACSFAQSSATSTVAETGLMRSEGKIYVVMAVVITILAGLILYLLRLEKKISHLEKES